MDRLLSSIYRVVLFVSILTAQSLHAETADFYSSESSNLGSIRSNAEIITKNNQPVLFIGDDQKNRSVRAVFSFDTAAIPDDARITSATLTLTSQARGERKGTLSLGKIMLAIKSGFLGNSETVETSDFVSSTHERAKTTFKSFGTSTFYFPSKFLSRINKGGKTQFRLYMQRNTNQNLTSDLIRFYNDHSSPNSRRPVLRINYSTGVNSAAPTPPSIGNDQHTWWQPKPGTHWQWQLTGTIDTSFNVDMYDVDLFTTSTSTINSLKAKGTKVICYYSAGSYENFRPDAASFPQSVIGKPNGWPGERWLDIRQLDILAPIMNARLDLAVQKGCDGVEPDNVDGYANNTGFALSSSDQLQYNRWLSTEAHARKLSIGLKNDLGQISQLVDDFDWALNEQCFQFDECEKLTPFVTRGKAVFGVEYSGDPNNFCPRANQLNFDWLKKNSNLDAARTSCR